MTTPVKKILPVSLPLAMVALAACAGGNPGFPGIAGWKKAGKVSVYDADSLWEHIDGAAELFIDYGVQTCRTADLSSDDITVIDGLTATVELYDMGTPLNAFGIFTLESSGRGESFPGAVEAVISPPYQALLLKGPVYVKVNTLDGGLTQDNGRSLLTALARALPGSADYPAELELLPRSGRIAGTEGYQARGFLGLTELTRCLYAEYDGTEEGAEPWLGFLMLPPPEAPSPWNDLAGRWESMEHAGRTVLYRTIPYRGLVGVIRTEQGILGVSGAADRAEMLHRLGTFLH